MPVTKSKNKDFQKKLLINYIIYFKSRNAGHSNDSIVQNVAEIFDTNLTIIILA